MFLTVSSVAPSPAKSQTRVTSNGVISYWISALKTRFAEISEPRHIAEAMRAVTVCVPTVSVTPE